MNRAIRRSPASRRARIVPVALIALVLAACGSTTPESPAAATAAPPSTAPSASAEATPTTPAATASAAASPSASPSASADVGQALVAKLGAFSFAAKSTLAGELVLGSARYSIAGTFDVSAVDHHVLVSIHAPGRQSIETIYTAGVVYQSAAGGPWYQKPPSLHDSDLTAVFRKVKSVTDAGVESKNGRSLHHLTAPVEVSLPPTLFGVTDPSMTGISGTVEFWADDDGTPVVMSVHNTWTQKVSGAAAASEMTVEFTFTEVGAPFTIAEPSEIWTSYASPVAHMTFGYPIDWDLFKNLKDKKLRFDQVGGPGATYADFYRYASQGFTANQIVAYIKTNPDHVAGFHVDSIKSVKMAGVAGRQMRIHATYKGKKRYWIYTFMVKGKYLYEVDFFDDKGHEAEDLKLVSDFVSNIVVK